MKRFWGILGRYVLVWLVYLLAMLLATSLFPGMSLDTSQQGWWVVALIVPVEFAVLVILLRPLLLFLTLPLNALSLGLPSLLFNALILKLTADVNGCLVVTSYRDAFFATVLMTAVATSVIGWLGLDEAYPLLQTLLYRVGRRWGPRRTEGSRRGLLILQIDGLSSRALVHAMKRGRVPTLSALVKSGSHDLVRWSSGLPSNTPAVQAGMLYGTRDDVPGYRWFDREDQTFKVVSSPSTARELDERLQRSGFTPLLAGGSCISSLLSGGADKRLLTVSTMAEFRQSRRLEQADLNLFYVSPTAYTGALLAGLWDYLSGLTLGTIGLLRRRRPRLRGHPLKLAQSAVTNAVMRHAAFFWLRQDMVRGAPVIYSNFVGYDDVAHFSGPTDYEAMVLLAAFDRGLRKLRRFARRHAVLDYDLVVLSDHGQTASVPFRLIDGRSLGQVVADSVGQAVDQGASAGDAAYLDALLRELAAGVGRTGWAVRRGERTLRRIRDRRGSGADQEARSDRSLPARSDEEAGTDERPELAVCVSGCLAHLYLRGEQGRLSLEQLRERCPGLVPALLAHPGVGFAVARLASGEVVALGQHGIRNLNTGEVADQDPLAPFGEPRRWGPELVRLIDGPSSGDLILNGAWLADRKRVVVFEEQTSSHGGLGGPQTMPFVLLPATWNVSPGAITGPEALFREMSARLPNMPE
ncbi:MAG: phage holin family protein [Candidatus Krumholzibacteriia bacterium]